MGRRRTAAQIKRQADLALARENYYKNKPASTLTTVKKREIEAVVYASQAIKAGANSALMTVQCSNSPFAHFEKDKEIKSDGD
jgi:hypothetical protein